MALFQQFRIPLCLAVVPAWLTRSRWEAMAPFLGDGELFCWHMHGYRHQNHETQGKKQEFGLARPRETVHQDLSRGYARLQDIMGSHFFPVFTPPWNRCSTEAMESLKTLNFKAVSRSFGGKPLPPPNLPDIAVHVDLHTRKDPDPQTGWVKLLGELETGLASGRCGIMLHHMRMNDPAFLFLEYLLDLIAKTAKFSAVTYRELV